MRSVFLPFTFECSWRCKYGNTSSITWEASTCKHRHKKYIYKQEGEAPDRNVHVCACADFLLSAQQHFPGFKASLFLSVESQCSDECLALIGRITPRLWGRSGSRFTSRSCFSLHLYVALLNMSHDQIQNQKSASDVTFAAVPHTIKTQKTQKPAEERKVNAVRWVNTVYYHCLYWPILKSYCSLRSGVFCQWIYHIYF